MRIPAVLTAAFLLAATAPAAHADVIVENLGGALGTATLFVGESFTTPAGGPWSAIAFQFYSDIPATTPSAAGTAFLLTQEYLGTPSALGTTTPGFLADSTGVVDDSFVFSPSVTLQANTAYYLYADAAFNTSGGNALAGGAAYFAGSSSASFATEVIPGTSSLQATNFTLTGTSAVPEPSSLALGLVGLGAAVGLRVRARRERRGGP